MSRGVWIGSDPFGLDKVMIIVTSSCVMLGRDYITYHMYSTEILWTASNQPAEVQGFSNTHSADPAVNGYLNPFRTGKGEGGEKGEWHPHLRYAIEAIGLRCWALWTLLPALIASGVTSASPENKTASQ